MEPPLSKSDLLFALLSAAWEDADEKMEDLLTELNKTGFGFNRDFILKTCLTLLGKGAAYNVAKFRDKETRENIITRWDDIADAIMEVKDYVLRTSISGAFSGNPDNLIDKCIKEIDSKKELVVSDIYGIIRAEGRNLEVTRNTILDEQYGSKNIHLFFNLWYRDFNYAPSFTNNSPQIDHIFPQSQLKKIKLANPSTGVMNILKYKQADRDQIANLMLLTADENGAGGKVDILPEVWFADKSDEYLNMHLIPKDKDLWKLQNYDMFIEERKKLIEQKFGYLLLKT